MKVENLSNNKQFLACISKHGAEEVEAALEIIADACWNKTKEKQGIKIFDIYRHNACNHTISGQIKIGDVEYGFIVQMGDWNGTLIEDWGLADDVGTFEPPPPIVYTFVPRDDFLQEKRPDMYKVYLSWKKEAWFKKKKNDYNYDRHFAPGSKTEKYYRDWADNKSLKIEIEYEIDCDL